MKTKISFLGLIGLLFLWSCQSKDELHELPQLAATDTNRQQEIIQVLCDMGFTTEGLIFLDDHVIVENDMVMEQRYLLNIAAQPSEDQEPGHSHSRQYANTGAELPSTSDMDEILYIIDSSIAGISGEGAVGNVLNS